MLKKIFFLTSMLFLFMQLSCPKLASITINRDIDVEIPVNAIAAGETVNKTLNIPIQAIKEAIADKATAGVTLDKLTLTQTSLSIPDSVAFTFSDIVSSDISVENQLAGTMPSGATGKKTVLTPPATPVDYKSYYQSATSFKTTFNIKAKNATTKATLIATFTFKIEIEIGI